MCNWPNLISTLTGPIGQRGARRLKGDCTPKSPDSKCIINETSHSYNFDPVMICTESLERSHLGVGNNTNMRLKLNSYAYRTCLAARRPRGKTGTIR